MEEEIVNKKIGIIVVVYNLNSKIFILQIEAIKSFCKDKDYTIEIFDNSDVGEYSEHIEYHSNIFGLNYTKTFSADRNSSTSHSFAADLAYMKVKDRYNLLAFFDHDLIALRVFSIEEIIGDKIGGGLGQFGGAYVWPGLFFLNNDKVDKSLIGFSPIPGFDTGGSLHKLIDHYGKENFFFSNEAYQQNPGFIDAKYGYISLLHNQTFAHCKNGSNWENIDRHEERLNSFINLVKEKTGL